MPEFRSEASSYTDLFEQGLYIDYIQSGWDFIQFFDGLFIETTGYGGHRGRGAAHWPTLKKFYHGFSRQKNRLHGFTLTGREVMRLAMAAVGDKVFWVFRE